MTTIDNTFLLKFTFKVFWPVYITPNRGFDVFGFAYL